MIKLRRYKPDYSDIGISKDRYLELLHFCRQLPEWQKQADSYLGASAQNYDPSPHSKGAVSDPTQLAVLRREQYCTRIGIINQAAQAAGAEWSHILIQNVCYARPLWQFDPVIMPTSNRNAYYAAKKLFFKALDGLVN